METVILLVHEIKEPTPTEALLVFVETSLLLEKLQRIFILDCCLAQSFEWFEKSRD